MATAREAAFLARLQRRSARLSPALQDEILEAWRIIRESLSDAEVARLIDSGQIDAIVDDALMDRATVGLRAKIVESVQRSFRASVPDLPNAGTVDGQIAVAFDTLNPRVIDAVRKLDSRVINALSDSVRETVRAYVENGLRDGRSARAIAKDLKPLLGLAPNQATAVENYRKALESGTQKSLDYKLRDRRYDTRVSAGTMTPEQIDKAVEVYRRKMEQFNAATNAQTAARDSAKLGQHLSWLDAVDKRVVDPGSLFKRWVTVGDDRVRPEHQVMNGEEVPYDNYYSNGDMVPGESSYNCRCTSRYVVKRAQPAIA
jgi:hypothetical protein